MKQQAQCPYLTEQLVTYIGNKRKLLPHIERAVVEARTRLGGRELRSVDLFSGSGVVARLLKQHSSAVASNDLESYARAVAECYLADPSESDLRAAHHHAERLNLDAERGGTHHGFISELYAPEDDTTIKPGERCFYSTDNARRLDFYSQELQLLPPSVRRLLLGPLLSAASVHANTGGVFKGFYKDKNTGIGKFGGTASDATNRILSPITLAAPVTSPHPSDHVVYQRDASELVRNLAEFDFAYIDPPYNQHPYGSNYFMLNLLVDYKRPSDISRVSGIPKGWNRSQFNVRKHSLRLLEGLMDNVPARFVLLSFNSEGYISPEEIRSVMGKHGSVDEQILTHNTFRASRNLRGRDLHVSEHLFLLDRG